jgi:hypothetical protein
VSRGSERFDERGERGKRKGRTGERSADTNDGRLEDSRAEPGVLLVQRGSGGFAGEVAVLLIKGRGGRRGGRSHFERDEERWRGTGSVGSEEEGEKECRSTVSLAS